MVALFRSVVDAVDPSVVLITETNVPHEDNVAYFGSAATPEAHAVYQFTLPPLVLHALTTGDAAPLRRWAATLEQRAGTTFLNFLASHDGVGVRPARGWLTPAQIDALADGCRRVGGVVNEAAVDGGSEPYELAATWRALCGDGVDDDVAGRRVVAGHAAMFALAGIPLVYAHSLAASPNDTTRFAATGLGRDLNRGRFASPEEYLAAVERSAGRIVDLLAWRRTQPAFHPDAAAVVHDTDGGTFVVERSLGSSGSLVAVNLGLDPAEIEVGGAWRTRGGCPARPHRDASPPRGRCRHPRRVSLVAGR